MAMLMLLCSDAEYSDSSTEIKKMGRSFNLWKVGCQYGKSLTGLVSLLCYTHAARYTCPRPSSLFCYELDSNLGQPKKCYNSRIFLGNKSRDSKQFLASVPWPNFAQNCTYLLKLHLLLAYSSKGNTMSVPYTHKLQLTGC